MYTFLAICQTRDSLYLLQTQHPEQAPPLWPGYRILLLSSKGPLLHPHHFLHFLSCEVVLELFTVVLWSLPLHHVCDAQAGQVQQAPWCPGSLQPAKTNYMNVTAMQTIQWLYDLWRYTIESYNVFISFDTTNGKITNQYQFCKASIITKHWPLLPSRQAFNYTCGPSMAEPLNHSSLS